MVFVDSRFSVCKEGIVILNVYYYYKKVCLYVCICVRVCVNFELLKLVVLVYYLWCLLGENILVASNDCFCIF